MGRVPCRTGPPRLDSPPVTALSLADAAIAYAEAGWAVFPCRPRGKTPLTEHGVKDATTNLAVVKQWWADTPDANIGVATGQPSGIWVLDIDGDPGLQSLRALADTGHTVPLTLSSGTGHGTHLFYLAPPGLTIRNRAGVRPGIDVRGDGGYVIVPPSVHPTGRRYRWRHPEDEGVAS